MFETMRAELAELKRGEPGRRFCDFYDFRQSRRRPGFSTARALTILSGLILLVGGVAIGWLPGPGGFVAIIGLALIAQEFRPMAAVLDWCEPKLRTLWSWITRTWRRLSTSARLVVAMTLLLTTASAGYMAYSLLLR